MNKKIPVLAYASGIAANNPDCRLGPGALKKSDLLLEMADLLDWQPAIASEHNQAGMAALPEVARLNQILAQKTQAYVRDHQSFLVLGGDHSCAIGTWSGASAALKKRGPIGLIWIDAHMDSHTPQTTESGNIHGMPLASLLGYGAKELTGIMDFQPKLLPEHVCLIGVRSFEKGEAGLLKKLNVKIFYSDEVKKRGLADIFRQARNIVTNGTVGYGISIDLDAIDPQDAPGVGKPELHGLAGKEFYQQLKLFNHDPTLLGLEIVEFNPKLDQEHKTEKLISDIIHSVFV